MRFSRLCQEFKRNGVRSVSSNQNIFYRRKHAAELVDGPASGEGAANLLRGRRQPGTQSNSGAFATNTISFAMLHENDQAQSL